MDPTSLADALDLERCSSATLRKARLALSQGIVWADLMAEGVWWVRASSGDKSYRVQIGGAEEDLPWITCTCPYGMTRGHGKVGCYHAAAVVMLERRTREG